MSWRTESKNRQEGRTRKLVHGTVNGKLSFFPYATMATQKPDLHATMTRDPLCGYVKYGPPGHQHSVVLYAMV